jgi:hypothetical protein
MLFNLAVLPLIVSLAGSAVAAPHRMDASLMVCASFTLTNQFGLTIFFLAGTQEGKSQAQLSLLIMLTKAVCSV